MGKIKSKLIKRTVKNLLQNGIQFNEDFEENKKILGKQMPSKKLRNQIAGYASRVKKQEKANALKVPEKE
jgi:ribosomal protein S17E